MADSAHAFGPFILDARRGVLQRDGKDLAVGARGIALLEILLAAEGRVVCKSDLLEQAWPDQIVEEVNLSVQIAALRKALGPPPDGQDWIITVPRIGYRLPMPGQARSTPRSGPPSLAVLAFAFVPGASDDAALAAGLRDGLVSALSRFRSVSVVSPRPPGEVADARYVLSGSIRRDDREIRVTAQLLGTEAGTTLWADHFDGDTHALFAFEDRVTELIVGQVEPHIRKAEIERVRHERSEDLGAYDLYLRALPGIYGSDPAANAASIELLERAIRLDASLGVAMAHAAWACERRDTFNMPSIGIDVIGRGVELAREAVRQSGDDPFVLAAAGFVLLRFSAEEKALGLGAVRRAAAANPSDPLVLNFLGISNVLAGDYDEALAAYHRAAVLTPDAPENYESFAGLAFAYFFKGEFEKALGWHLRALETFEPSPPIYWNLVATYAQLGRMTEARAALDKLLEISPDLTLSKLRRRLEMGTPDRRYEPTLDGLRKAGLPEV